MSNRGDYYRLTCPFCHTLLTVVPEQEGTKVKCPDCFSMLDVGAPPAKKQKNSQRGGQMWTQPSDAGEGKGTKGQSSSSAKEIDDLLIDDSADVSPADVGVESGELKLADAVDRPAVSSLYGFESGEDDLLAPKKRKRAAKNDAKNADKDADTALGADDLQLADDIDDLPLVEDDVPSLESIGTLVPESEPDEEAERNSQTSKSDRRPSSKPKKRNRSGKPKSKLQGKLNSKRGSVEPDSIDDHGRPRFRHAELFMATVSMITDTRVLLAAGAATLLMLVGGIACEAILPVGYDTSGWSLSTTMAKTGLKILFGYLPYYAGLIGLWATAGFIFRDATEGFSKVQRWSVAGKSEFWSTFLLFAFGFFIAGLPAAVFSLVMIPMRMVIAPLFLISAWFNRSPWMIVSTDWFAAISENKSQWMTVYYWFVAFAFAGFIAGLLFMVRGWVEVFAVDVLLTIMGIGINIVLTLAFAAIAGWHTGAVIESLDTEG